MELLNDKLKTLAEELQISDKLAHSLLIKNSWDEEEAKDAFCRPDYVQSTLSIKFENNTIQPVEIEDTTTCPVCQCEYEGDKLTMSDCGYEVCEECFTGYLI